MSSDEGFRWLTQHQTWVYEDRLRAQLRQEYAHRVFAAIQATVNLLLVASGHWPDKKPGPMQDAIRKALEQGQKDLESIRGKTLTRRKL